MTEKGASTHLLFFLVCFLVLLVPSSASLVPRRVFFFISVVSTAEMARFRVRVADVKEGGEALRWPLVDLARVCMMVVVVVVEINKCR